MGNNYIVLSEKVYDELIAAAKGALTCGATWPGEAKWDSHGSPHTRLSRAVESAVNDATDSRDFEFEDRESRAEEPPYGDLD